MIREALALRAPPRRGVRRRVRAARRRPSDTCAFRRGDDVVVAVPVRGDEPEVELPPGDWRNVLEGIDRCLGGYAPAVFERLS